MEDLKKEHHRLVKTVNILIKAGAVVNAQNTQGETALYCVLHNGLVKCIASLLEAGADGNVSDGAGVTSLMNASRGGYLECMRRLIEAGADVNASNSHGTTAFMMASCRGHLECVNRLLEAGAVVNAACNNGNTALMWASGNYRHQCVDVLLNAGADINLTDNNHCNALDVLQFYEGDYEECNHHLIKCIKRLLRAGIHINQYDKYFHRYALGRILLENEPSKYEDAIMVLYAAGEIIVGGMTGHTFDLPTALQFKDKLQLKHMCRYTIRKHLLKLDPHQHLFCRIPKLGLPSIMTGYLLFNVSLDKEIDDDDDDSDDDEDNDYTDYEDDDDSDGDDDDYDHTDDNDDDDNDIE